MYLNDFSLCVSYPVGLRWCHTTGDNQSTWDTVPQTTNQRAACCREGREEGREEGEGREEDEVTRECLPQVKSSPSDSSNTGSPSNAGAEAAGKRERSHPSHPPPPLPLPPPTNTHTRHRRHTLDWQGSQWMIFNQWVLGGRGGGTNIHITTKHTRVLVGSYPACEVHQLAT